MALWFLLSLLISGARAELPESFEGTFHSPVSSEEAQAQIDEAIEEAVAEVFFLMRSFARRQLRRATLPCQRMELWEEDGQVGIQCDDRTPAIAPPDGTVTPYVDEDGREMEISHEVHPDHIIQVFDDAHGVRTNVYTLHEGGAVLHIDTEVDSPRLPEPVEYTEVFVR